MLLLNLPGMRQSRQKFLLGAAFFFVGMVAFCLLGDLFYFRLVGRHTGANIWNLMTSFSLVWFVAWKEYKWALACAMLWTAGLVWAGIKIAGKSGEPRRGPWFWEKVCIVLLGWTLCGAWHGFAAAVSPRRVYSQGLEYGHLVQNGVFSMLYALSPSWYVPNAKLRRGHVSLGWMSSEEAAGLTAELLRESRQETSAAENFPFLRRRTEFNADARGRNLVVLALESLEASRVDALAGTSYGASPNLDKLIRRGVSFDNFYACGTDSSLEGIGALMTGVCRLSGTNYFGKGMEDSSVSRLGKLFKDNGYNTFFVRASQDDWMFIGPLARLTGFQTTDDKDLQKRFQKKEVWDADALAFLAEQIKTSDKPFFGFFFSLSTHEPQGSFLPRHFDAETEGKFPERSYLRSLAYTDWAVGRFITELEKAGLFENTVFVIVGDHRLRGAAGADSAAERYRIPLVITAPGALPPGRVARVGGQSSVLPTLVDLFHLPGAYSAMGNSLLDDSAPQFAFVSVQDGEHFGLITSRGVVFDDEKLFSKRQLNSPALRRQAAALNKAVYEALVKGCWSAK